MNIIRINENLEIEFIPFSIYNLVIRINNMPYHRSISNGKIDWAHWDQGSYMPDEIKNIVERVVKMNAFL